MLPIVSHEARTHRWPYVTICLIGLNVLAFAFELSASVRFVPFLQEWGLVPARVNADVTLHNLATITTSMFLHVGWVHLIGNMWFLYVFGDAVEDAFGPYWYLAIYLVAGFFGDVFYLAVSSSSPVPVVGASGAISGVLAASLVLWPHARLKTPALLLLLYVVSLFYPVMIAVGIPGWMLGGALIFVLSTFATIVLMRTRVGGSRQPFLLQLLGMVELPSWLVLGFFFTLQLWSGALVLVNPAYGGAVGFWAHIGGFVVGGVLAFVFPKQPVQLARRPVLG